MVDIAKWGGRVPSTLTRLGWFYHHDGMYARKRPLPLCVLRGLEDNRGRILGRNWDKNLDFSTQSPLLADFTPHLWFSTIWTWGLERRKPDRKLYPLWFRKPYKTINHWRILKFFQWIVYCRKPKQKVETSSLRNLKIMPKNVTFMNSTSGRPLSFVPYYPSIWCTSQYVKYLLEYSPVR